ncbi:MAG: DUF6249 domain-containing protein [Spirochaetota bacterium]|nr:DUF6249 domain-containing protein [Spirochaetota bacterium]
MESVPSVAAQIIVTIIPIVGIVAGFTIFFFYMLWDHKRKVLMIEKGIEQKSLDLESLSLLSGLILFAIGLSLTLFFYIKEGISYSILGGLFPLSIGLSLIIFFVTKITTKDG